MSPTSTVTQWSLSGEDNMNDETLYNRQKDLDLNIPEKVFVIGTGGIGSWVALNMGLIGIKKLFMIDYDIIEEHNLNRTLFREMDIGMKKTTSLMDLIMERRTDIDIRIYDKKIEELTTMELEELKDCLIIDCRDIIDELPEMIRNNKRIKLGYDGLSITVILNPDYNKIWELDENRGYEITPSFLAPCQFLATIVTTLITDPTFNLEQMDNEIITFDIQAHIKDMLAPEWREVKVVEGPIDSLEEKDIIENDDELTPVDLMR